MIAVVRPTRNLFSLAFFGEDTDLHQDANREGFQLRIHCLFNVLRHRVAQIHTDRLDRSKQNKQPRVARWSQTPVIYK